MDQLKFAAKQVRCQARLMFGLKWWETDPQTKKQRKKDARNALVKAAAKNSVSTPNNNSATEINTNFSAVDNRTSIYTAVCNNHQQKSPVTTTPDITLSTPFTHSTHATVGLGVEEFVRNTVSGRKEMIGRAIKAARNGYVARGPGRLKAARIIQSLMKHWLQRTHRTQQQNKIELFT